MAKIDIFKAKVEQNEPSQAVDLRPGPRARTEYENKICLCLVWGVLSGCHGNMTGLSLQTWSI